MKTFKKIALGTALAASSLAIAAPASAQDYNRYHRHSGDNATAAIVGGVIGLALGAVIASSSNRGYDNYNYRNGTWYEGYQYRNGSFYDRQGYRRYDRNTWRQRHYQGDRRDGYDQRDGGRDGYGYQGQYGNGYESQGYNGGSYNSGGYYGGGNYSGGYTRGY